MINCKYNLYSRLCVEFLSNNRCCLFDDQKTIEKRGMDSKVRRLFQYATIEDK